MSITIIDIPKYAVGDMLHLYFKNDPILLAILKYRDHPSIITIKSFRYQPVPFQFSYTDENNRKLKQYQSLSGNRYAC